MNKLKTVMLSFFTAFTAVSLNAQDAPVAAVGQPAKPVMLEKVEAKPGEAKISYEKWQLANGLVLYVHEDHSDPIVHVEVTYRVGSNREHLGITGFAHFFEHMMFQGSKHVADEEHIKTIESCGGQMNGTTNSDRTNYFETVPSNMLETALWLESDRMGWLIPAVTKEKFEIQRDAVKNEKEQNLVNQPYALALAEVKNQYMYPKGHPYSWPVIGYTDDLDRVTVEDLKNFFNKWYGPNNAVVVISGDVKTKEVVDMVDKYFGPIPRGQEVRKMRPQLEVKNQNIYATVNDHNAYFPLTDMSYPTVQNYHRDEAPLDIVSEILGGGRNSPFYQRLVKSGYAVQAGVSHPCQELAGEFQIIVVTDPFKSQQRTMDSIQAVLNDFNPENITDEELERVKATFESRYINVLESVQGKASQLTSWELMVGKQWNLEDEINRYQKVTKQDLVRVYNKYIKTKGACVVYVQPVIGDDKYKLTSVNPYPGEVDQVAEKQYEGLTYTEPPSNFDRSKKPTPPPAKAPNIPQYTKETLENGIKIIHTKTDELPKLTFYFEIEGGRLFEAYDSKKIGLANLTAQMMNEGTQKRTAEEIDAALDKLGANISFSSFGNSTTVYVTTLTKNVDATLAILEEMLYEPAFNSENFKIIKDNHDQALYSLDKNHNAVLSKAFTALVYDQSILGTHPMGYHKTIGKIGLDDVKDFYNKYYAPELTSLTIVGNMELSELKPKLQFLNKWQKKNVAVPQISTEFTPAGKTTIYLINKYGATQSRIMVGRLAMPFDYNGKYYKTYVANYMLGGSFNSRINLNLREEKGYTYGARSFLTGSDYPGYWAVSTSVKARATDSALVEIMKEVKKYKESGITPEELKFTKNSINQSDALNYETSFDKAGFLNRIIDYNLPVDYVKQQNEVLNKLTVDEINALAKEFFDYQNMIIVVVGDESDVKKALKATGIGPIESVDYDKVNIKEIK